MKIILFFLAALLTISLNTYSRDQILNAKLTDVRNIEYGITVIPSDIKYSGTPVAMVKWDDNLGSNLLFLTESEESSKGDVRSKELFGYHFITDGAGNKQLWKIYDYIKECPVDLTLTYLNESLSITDLDNDGTGESSLLYKMSCKGDVSSDILKLIMHEGKKKYALRGSMNLIMNGEYLEKGTMKADPSFKSAPEEFLEFAKGQWSKFDTKKIGE